MLITKNNEKKRELVEQVQYLTDYHNQDKALASWGIRIVGQIESESELPAAETYTGAYGDTYAVGKEAPYDFYIFTRSSLAGSGDYWFPFGKISIAGPQGPQGVQGEKGDTGESSRWYVGSNVPQPTSLYKPGDMYLHVSTGNVYQFTDNEVWLQVSNIIGPQGPRGPQGEAIVGPQGPQGPKGERGDVAGLVNIRGQLTSESQLPSPEDLNNLTVAYLINGDLWIQFGEKPQTATWNNVGPFNVGTMVTVDGTYVNTLEMDNYYIKPEQTAAYNRIPYIKATTLDQGFYNVANNDTSSIIERIPIYRKSTDGKQLPASNEGYLTTAYPINKYHCANKDYVDNQLQRFHVRPVLSFTWEGELGVNQKASMTYINTSDSLASYETLDIIIKLKSGALVSKQIYPQSFEYADPVSDKYGADWSFINDGQTIGYKIVSVFSPSPSFEVTNYSSAENSKIVRIDVVAYKT